MDLHNQSASSSPGAPVESGVAGVIAGRYRLRERIGTGRLGEIFAAHDETYRGLGIRKTVALQLLHGSLAGNEEMVAKLRWGFGTLRDDAHPGIVACAEFGHDGVYGYLVMERLEGASLQELLRIEASFDVSDTFAIMRAAGDGLAYLHSRSMVHGKVSPGSVFVTFDQNVKLIDVVPLAPLDAGRGRTSGPTGTYPLDVRDDVFGLAALAYEMLTGRHPFNHRAPDAGLASNRMPARIQALTERQWRAMSRGLSASREQRFASVDDFLLEMGIDEFERLPLPQDSAAGWTGGHEQDWPADIETDRPVVTSATMTVSAASPAAQDNDTAAQDTDMAEPSSESVAPDDEGSPAESRRRLAPPLLAFVVLALAGWQILGQPRDDIARVSDYLDPIVAKISTSLGIPGVPGEQGNGTATSAASTPATRSSVGNPDSAREAPSGTDGDVPGRSGPAVPPGGDVAEAPAASAANALVESVPVSEAIPIPAPADSDGPTIDGDAAVAAVAVPGTPLFDFSEATVRVSEGAGTARVTIIRADGAEGRVFWWTSDVTAKGGIDFIATESPVPGFATGGYAETLHIPLIDDSIPEPREEFFVNLGRFDEQRRQLEPLSSVRVEIADDDLR